MRVRVLAPILVRPTAPPLAPVELVREVSSVKEPGPVLNPRREPARRPVMAEAS